MPVPSLGAVYETRPSSLVVVKVEPGSPILVLHHVAPRMDCINNLTPEYIRDLVQLKTSSYAFRYENTIKVPTVRTVTYGQCSFRFESARVWNSLPNDMRKVSEFAEFRRQIRTWTGPSCKCAICRGSGG